MGDFDSRLISEELRKMNEWAKAVIFDHEANVVASTIQANPSELRPYLRALESRDQTIGGGFTLLGEHYDVHRFHSPLVYGRRGGPDEGEGIALCVANRNGLPVFALITYTFPILSARAVPQLIEFCRKFSKI